MLLKEMVLTSMENFGAFEVNGKELTKESYLVLADYEVKTYYLDIVNGEAKAIITLED